MFQLQLVVNLGLTPRYRVVPSFYQFRSWFCNESEFGPVSEI